MFFLLQVRLAISYILNSLVSIEQSYPLRYEQNTILKMNSHSGLMKERQRLIKPLLLLQRMSDIIPALGIEFVVLNSRDEERKLVLPKLDREISFRKLGLC